MNTRSDGQDAGNLHKTGFQNEGATRRRWLRVLALVAVVVLVASCGSDSDDDASPSPSTPSNATPATGDPILVGSLCFLSGNATDTGCKSVAEAYYAKVNAEGGVRGRPVKQVACDVNFAAPENVPNCIRDLIAQQVVAFSGNVFNSGSILCDALHANNMASIGPSLQSACDFSDPNSFPAFCSFCQVAVSADYIAKQTPKPKKVAVIFSPTTAAQTYVKTMTAFFNRDGIEIKAITAAQTETNWLPFAAQAKDFGAETLYIIQSIQQYGPILRAANQLGYEPDFAFTQGVYDQAYLENEPEDLTGAVVSFFWPPFNDKRFAEYDATMKQYSPGDLKRDYTSALAWEGAKMTVAGLKAIPQSQPMSRQALLDSMKTLKFEDALLPAPIDWGKLNGTPGPCPIVPRAPNGLNYVMKVDESRKGFELVSNDLIDPCQPGTPMATVTP